VPSYAIIIASTSHRRGGARIGIVLTATMLGMALGGWMSGAIFDLTGFVQDGVHERHRVECRDMAIAVDAARQKRRQKE